MIQAQILFEKHHREITETSDMRQEEIDERPMPII
jgi:hypothetical protein